MSRIKEAIGYESALQSSFTPGPWTQGTTTEGKCCVWLAGHVDPQNDMGPVETWIDCNSEANARLIAAAPELLDALETIVDYMWDNECRPLEKARAAIAKATGRES